MSTTSIPVLSGVGDAIGSLGDATQAVIAAGTVALKRTALVVLGLLILAIAVFVLLREPITSAAKSGAKAAAFAA